MNSEQLRDRIARRVAAVAVPLTSTALEQLARYLEVLARWNARMNLTALPVQDSTDEALDRLIIEPLVASRYVPEGDVRWIDVGSGGGSPAIPLKIVRPEARLTMVDSHARKTAFLREAVRMVGLEDCTVENTRFEAFATTPEARGRAELVTVRALKLECSLMDAIRTVLAANGHLLLFRSLVSEALSNYGPGLRIVESTRGGEPDRPFELVLLARL